MAPISLLESFRPHRVPCLFEFAIFADAAGVESQSEEAGLPLILDNSNGLVGGELEPLPLRVRVLKISNRRPKKASRLLVDHKINEHVRQPLQTLIIVLKRLLKLEVPPCIITLILLSSACLPGSFAEGYFQFVLFLFGVLVRQRDSR